MEGAAAMGRIAVVVTPGYYIQHSDREKSFGSPRFFCVGGWSSILPPQQHHSPQIESIAPPKRGGMAAGDDEATSMPLTGRNRAGIGRRLSGATVEWARKKSAARGRRVRVRGSN
jgi:hypothetical protein